MACEACDKPARLLIVPGLHDSGPAHWQSWLQGLHRHSLRVQQDDWAEGNVERWSAAVDGALARQPAGRWIAVAHSFGCLALAHHLSSRPDSGIVAALLVAPADPARFAAVERLPQAALPLRTTLVTSSTDPWMKLSDAQAWARIWGSRLHHLGDAGHINTESGFGPFPFAQQWVSAARQRLQRERSAVGLNLGSPPPHRPDAWSGAARRPNSLAS
jgi:predicted alpha/beta hydrolase family esterase